MAARTIRVQVVKSSGNTVTIKLMSLNRKMPVPREEFLKRVKQSLYTVINTDEDLESLGLGEIVEAEEEEEAS